MKNLLTIISLYFIYIVPAKAFDFYKCSNKIVKKYNAIKDQDTSLLYYRTCRACSTNPPMEMYMLYKKEGCLVLDVYRWYYNTPNTFKRVCHIGNLSNRYLIDFITNNLNDISKEAANNFPFEKVKKYTDSLGDEKIKETGILSNHGPKIAYRIKFGDHVVDSFHDFWSSVDDYNNELPTITKMIKHIHDTYSLFSKEKIIDN